MEKNLLKAFILSFLILWVWGALNPKKPVEQPFQEVELAENKHDTSNAPKLLLDNQMINVNSQLEEYSILKNDTLTVEFSNIGGKIVDIKLNEFEIGLPVTGYLDIDGFNQFVYKMDKLTAQEIHYVYENEDVRVEKIFRLSSLDYLIDVEINFSNRNNSPINMPIDTKFFTVDISKLDKNFGMNRDKSLFEYVIAADEEVERKGNAFKFTEKDIKAKMSNTKWMGFRDRYFSVIVRPDFVSDQYSTRLDGRCVLVKEAGVSQDVSQLYATKAQCTSAATEGNLEWFDNLTLLVSSRSVNLPPSGQFGQNYQIYFGPQKLELLKSYKLGFEDIMKFSNWSLLDTIAKGIYGFMHFLHKFIPNWGICIIIISVLIYGAMYPLTLKGMTSMKRMQALQPQIRKLQDQYKNNHQKLNQEMMSLYKEHKVNPIGGCLPLFLQFPVFIGLYQVLWRSVSFKGAEFLWIKDLSEPDRLVIFPFTLPFVGNELNILPILMIIVMVFQQKLSSKNMVITDSAQAAQQKMMMTFFPVFIGFIFYKFASGLALYFTIFYLLSTLTQWKMSKMTKVV